MFTARYIIQVNFRVYGGAMAQAVSCQPLTADSRVRLQVSPCGVCDGQSVTGTEFSDSTSVPPSVSFRQSSILIFILIPLCQPWGPSKKQCSFASPGALDLKALPLFFGL